MKLKIVLIISIIFFIFSSGCSNKKTANLQKNGKVYLEEHNYKKAKEALSEELGVNSSDENVRSMYKQATVMDIVLGYENQKKYKKAISELETIEKIKNGSSVIKSEVEQKKKDLVLLNEKYESDQEKRKENAKIVSNKDGYRIEQEAIKEQEKQLEKYQDETTKKEDEDDKKSKEEVNKEEDDLLDDSVISPPAKHVQDKKL
jgi:hypothetical protein